MTTKWIKRTVPALYSGERFRACNHEAMVVVTTWRLAPPIWVLRAAPLSLAPGVSLWVYTECGRSIEIADSVFEGGAVEVEMRA